MLRNLFLVLMLLVTCPVTFAQSLTVGSWGGLYTDLQGEVFFDPYTEQTQTNIQIHLYEANEELPDIFAAATAYSLDVVELEHLDVIHGCERSLLAAISAGELDTDLQQPNISEDFFPKTLLPCAVASMARATVLVIDPHVFGEHAPESLADFFDVKKFPGKRALYRTPRGLLEWTLLADGVEVDQVYSLLQTPIGIERAFAGLEKLREHMIWLEGEESLQLLANGKVAMTMTSLDLLGFRKAQHKVHPRIIWDGHLLQWSYFGIPTSSENQKQARELIAFATSPLRQAALGRYQLYGPVRKSAFAYVSEKTRNKLPTSDKNRPLGLVIDEVWWQKHSDEMEKKFISWLQKG